MKYRFEAATGKWFDIESGMEVPAAVAEGLQNLDLAGLNGSEALPTPSESAPMGAEPSPYAADMEKAAEETQAELDQRAQAEEEARKLEAQKAVEERDAESNPYAGTDGTKGFEGIEGKAVQTVGSSFGSSTFGTDKQLEALNKRAKGELTTGQKFGVGLSGLGGGLMNAAAAMRGQQPMVDVGGNARGQVDRVMASNQAAWKADVNSPQNQLFRQNLSARTGISEAELKARGITMASPPEALAELEKIAVGLEKETERKFKSSESDKDLAYKREKLTADQEEALRKLEAEQGKTAAELERKAMVGRNTVAAYGKSHPSIFKEIVGDKDPMQMTGPEAEGAIKAIEARQAEVKAEKGRSSINVSANSSGGTFNAGEASPYNPDTIEGTNAELIGQRKELQKQLTELAKTSDKDTPAIKDLQNQIKTIDDVLKSRGQRADKVNETRREIDGLTMKMERVIRLGELAAAKAPELFKNEFGSWLKSSSQDVLRKYRLDSMPSEVIAFKDAAERATEDFGRQRSGAAIGLAEEERFKRILLGNGSLRDLRTAYHNFKQNTAAELATLGDTTNRNVTDYSDKTTDSTATQRAADFKANPL